MSWKRLNPIVLTHPISNHEKSIERPQLKYAMSFYEWRQGRTGLLMLLPSKTRYIRAIFSFSTLCIMIQSLLIYVIFTYCFFHEFIWAGLLLLGLLSSLCLMFHAKRMHSIFASLPMKPIVTIDSKNKRLIFRRVIPCVQITESNKKVILGKKI